MSAMVNNSDWQKMKQLAFESYALNGKIKVSDLEKMVEIGLEDGEFDEMEKGVLISFISNLTRADMTDEMWLKVDELVNKFELHADSNAFIEHLDDDDDEGY
jgi:hypothetical protein